MSIENLIAINDIRDKIYLYCRVLDRMDKEGAYSLWNKNSVALYHGIYEGSGPGFIDWVWESHLAMERHSHQITNTLIQVKGERAVSESYVTVALWTLPDTEGNAMEIVGRGRYLDTWSIQKDASGKSRWGIDRREHVLDMHSVNVLTRGDVAEQSRRDVNDPSFALFNAL